ncbi:M20 family metallo-hydrolase [Streptomyces hygroscopicus]|uniref:M20 family metallo-hydrolase n=1 Tax=Streptomyces hygroscopicus TaxID=1912 RepID=UPI00362C2D01
MTMVRDAVPLRERIDTDMKELAEIVDGSQPGWTRTALSEADTAGRRWALRRMRAAGLEAHIDPAGNVIGRLPGRDPAAGAILTGSHTDTVAGGGRFDGNVGFVGALEAVRALREADRRLDHDLVVVNFFSEEPNDFGLSCVGSRALTGQLTQEHLALTDDRGNRYADALTVGGIDPAEMTRARLDAATVRAFLELHIEQGPVLEEQGAQIGLVSTITGLARFRALFHGRRDHAGTMPMASRQDAGCAAAGTVLAVERIASAHEHGRGTIGSVTFTPEAVNIVSDRAEVFGELRSPEREWLEYAQKALLGAAGDEASRRGVTLDFSWLPSKEPADMSPALLDVCTDVVAGLGYSHSRMYSGAEHDAAIMAQFCPTAMIFVPSHDGRSHCPEEWTDSDDILAGVHALTESITRVDSAAFDR